VGISTPAAQAYGFKLTGRKFTPINYPGAGTTDPSGINNKGEIVGAEQADGTSPGKGFVLSHGHFTDIQFPGATATGANAINSLGGDRRSVHHDEWSLAEFCL
jgi:uncharacterized membrane protein